MKYATQIFIVFLIVFCSPLSFSQNKPHLTFVHDDGFDSINYLTFSPDSTRLITCTVKAIVWDVQTGDKLMTLPTYGTGCAAFTKDNAWIATGGDPYLLRIWDGKTGNLLYSNQSLFIQAPPLSIIALTFNPQENKIYFMDEKQTLNEWDFYLQTNQEIYHISPFPNKTIQFFRDGQRVLNTGSVISIFDNKLVYKFNNSASSLITNNNTVVILKREGSSNQLWNKEEYDGDNYEMINEYPSFVNYGRVIQIHPNGRYVLAGRTEAHDDETRIIDVHTAKACKTFQNAKGEDEDIDQIVFSPDGKQVALVSGNRIKLYDISDLTSSVKEAEALGR